MRNSKLSLIGLIFIVMALGIMPSGAHAAIAATYIDVEPDWDNATFGLFDPSDFSLESYTPVLDIYRSEVEANAGSSSQQQSIDSDYWTDLTASASESGTSAEAHTATDGSLGVSMVVGGLEASSEAITGYRFTVTDLANPLILLVKIPIIIDYNIDSYVTESDDDALAYMGLWNYSQDVYNETIYELANSGNIDEEITLTIKVNNYDTIWLYSGADLEATANPVPIPSALLLLGSGFAGVMILKRKRG